MSDLERQTRLAALRTRIADLERRPALAETAAPGAMAGGFPLAGPGVVHEVFADERRNGGAVLGFALGQARGLLGGMRQAVVYLQMTADSQEMGLPYGSGLQFFGFDAADLVLIRPANIAELLWAAEEALGCGAVAAVVADVAGQPKILDFTASRRLSMRAQSGGASVFLLRYGRWRESSAAQLRWHLAPLLSAPTPFDARAPGASRWSARLEKGALGQGHGGEWILEWTENGFRAEQSDRPGLDGTGRSTALSGAVPARLGDRLSQAG
jgi:protein ImuA